MFTLMITCTHSYRPTVYCTLPGRLIRGCQISDIFWPQGRVDLYVDRLVRKYIW